MAATTEWLELRSTEPGLVAELPLEEVDAAPDADRREGFYSLVVRESGGRRGIPTLYFDAMPLFGDREMSEVCRFLPGFHRGVLRAPSVPTYLAHACAFEGQLGLYIRDTYNRSAYRRRLERAGMTFQPIPLVTLDLEGRFATGDAVISPSFLVLGAAEEETPYALTGALLSFYMAGLRLGPLPGPELRKLTKALEGVVGLGANRPEDLIGLIKDRRVAREGGGQRSQARSSWEPVCDPE